MSLCLQLMYTSNEATSDVEALQDKLERKKKVEQTNETLQERFRRQFRENMDDMQKNLTDHTQVNVAELINADTFLGKGRMEGIVIIFVVSLALPLYIHTGTYNYIMYFRWSPQAKGRRNITFINNDDGSNW